MLNEGFMGCLGTGRAGAAVGCAASARTLARNALQKNGITNERKGKVMKEGQNSTRWLGLALAGSFLTFAVTTQAGKPVKPPPPPPTETSTIYFGHAGGIWRMNPDGSAKTAVCAVLEGAWPVVVPGQARHGERRWFLGLKDVAGTYPYMGGG